MGYSAVDTYGSWTGHGKPVGVKPSARLRGNRSSDFARGFNTNIKNLGFQQGRPSGLPRHRSGMRNLWENASSDAARSFNTSIADTSSRVMSQLAPNDQNNTSTTNVNLLSPVPNFDDAVARRFGTRKSDDAYLAWQGELNKNELGRSRDIEDQLVNRRSFEIALEKALRGIPDRYNQRGMRNSGLFDRGMGEFERDAVRAGGELERQFMRRQQDFNLSDLLAGQQYYSTIGDDAETDALIQAAKAASFNPNVLSGGSDVNRAATSSTYKGGG